MSNTRKIVYYSDYSKGDNTGPYITFDNSPLIDVTSSLITTSNIHNYVSSNASQFDLETIITGVLSNLPTIPNTEFIINEVLTQIPTFPSLESIITGVLSAMPTCCTFFDMEAIASGVLPYLPQIQPFPSYQTIASGVMSYLPVPLSMDTVFEEILPFIPDVPSMQTIASGVLPYLPEFPNTEFIINEVLTQIPTFPDMQTIASGILPYLSSTIQINNNIIIELINNTGGPSIIGTIAQISTTNNNSYVLSTNNSTLPIGIVYESGIMNGQLTKIITCGIIDVLLKDGESVDRGKELYTSDVSGRARDGNISINRRVGIALESKTAGTDILVKTLLKL